MIRHLATFDQGIILVPEEIVADELAMESCAASCLNGMERQCKSTQLRKPVCYPQKRNASSNFCALVWDRYINEYGQAIPSMWIPWAWSDLALFVLFALAWRCIRPLPGAQGS